MQVYLYGAEKVGLVSEHRLPENWSVRWELVWSCSVCSVFFFQKINIKAIVSVVGCPTTELQLNSEHNSLTLFVLVQEVVCSFTRTLNMSW